VKGTHAFWHPLRRSVRRFCKTVDRDDSTGPLARRLLAAQGNRQQFARRLAEATYTPEQLAVASPRRYAAMFERAAHALTAAEGEEWEGYADYEEFEGEGEEDEPYEDAASFVFEPLPPSAAGSSTDPLTPPSSSRRRSYVMQSTFSTSQEPVPLPIGKRLEFNDPKDKGYISRPREPPTATVVSRSTKVRATLTWSRMKNLSREREQLLELYDDAYWYAYRRAPPPHDGDQGIFYDDSVNPPHPMLALTFQGLDGRREAIVRTPPHSFAGWQGKATIHIAADEADPPPLIADTVHDYSSRRGVLNCD
jgi:hypothetical protein